jgi:small subunit ribosomal protein S17
MKKREAKTENSLKKTEIADAICNDKDCPVHGHLKVRGRVFEGRVTKKFHKRIAIELERMVYIRKYERYAKSKTKIHARLPVCMEKEIHVGDLIRVQECRPLSKIIHFVVVKKIKSGDNGK